MRLASSGTDLNIVGEAGLRRGECMLFMEVWEYTYAHSSVKGSRNLIVLLQPWAATQDLWKPEGAHCALHVPDLALSWCWCLHPLRRFPANTTYHIRMGQCLGAAGTLFDVQCRREWLGDARVERGRSAGDDETVIGVVPCRRTVIASARTQGQRGCHCWNALRWYRIDRAKSPWVTSGGSKTRWYYNDRGNIRSYCKASGGHAIRFEYDDSNSMNSAWLKVPSHLAAG